MTPRWAVLLTTFNRAQVTRACLTRLAEQAEHGVELEVVVCDAGSTDNTIDEIRAAWPGAVVVEGDASLYWSAGMRTAWEKARASSPDAFLWLNDDTLLDVDAIARLADAAADPERRDAVLVGATRDPDTGELTYSGAERRDAKRPLRWDRVEPTTSFQSVETMNGNCVLVPAAVVQDIGTLDPIFEHGMADFDYGLRAQRAGHDVILLPGTVGTCRTNPEAPERSFRQEWKAVRSTKDLPPRQWVTFARRWAGPAWPLYAASPYVRRLARALRPSSRTDA